MKWILVLLCVFWSNMMIFATSENRSLEQLDAHERETNYRLSSQRFYGDGMLEGDLLRFAESHLRKAIELRVAKLGLRAEVPLSEIKQKELAELGKRRLALQKAGQDLYNEKLQILEKLEAKVQMALRFKDDLQHLEVLDALDRKIEVLEVGDEETRGGLIQERQGLEKRLSSKGARIFRLKTSLGILKHYLSMQDWSDMTSILNLIINHVQKRSRDAMNDVYVIVPGEAISSNKAANLEGLLKTMPAFLTAINRFVLSFDREMVVAMSLSSRLDLAEAYEAEMESEDRPTEKLLYALGVLAQHSSHDNGFEGSIKELEEQMQSFEAAILITKEQEAERIRERLNRVAPIMVASSEEDSDEDSHWSEEINSSEESSDADSDNEVEVGAAGEAQNVPMPVLVQNNAEIMEHAGGAGERILPAVPDVQAVLDIPAEDAIPNEEDVLGLPVPVVPVGLNGDENLDTDTYFGQFQTGAHLAAFIKIKSMETKKEVLSAFLESARLEEARKHQDPNFWRLNLWAIALEKGLLNITQIQPVINMLQELVILGGEVEETS